MSNIERPTQELKTKGGYTIKYLTYVTGEENRTRRLWVKTMEDLKGEEALKAEFVIDDKVFDLVVKSVEGPELPAEGSASEKIRQMPLPDFQEVIEAISSVVFPKKKE